MAHCNFQSEILAWVFFVSIFEWKFNFSPNFIILSIHAFNFNFDPPMQTSSLNIQHTILDLNANFSYLKYVICLGCKLSPISCNLTYISNYSLLVLSKKNRTYSTLSSRQQILHNMMLLGWKVFKLIDSYCGKPRSIPIL